MRILAKLMTGEILAALKPGELAKFEQWRAGLGRGCDWRVQCSAEALAVIEAVDELTRQGLIRQLNRGNVERLEVASCGRLPRERCCCLSLGRCGGKDWTGR